MKFLPGQGKRYYPKAGHGSAVSLQIRRSLHPIRAIGRSTKLL
ncbi:hypothetical protein [Microcoleus sp. K5-D4]